MPRKVTGIQELNVAAYFTQRDDMEDPCKTCKEPTCSGNALCEQKIIWIRARVRTKFDNRVERNIVGNEV